MDVVALDETRRLETDGEAAAVVAVGGRELVRMWSGRWAFRSLSVSGDCPRIAAGLFDKRGDCMPVKYCCDGEVEERRPHDLFGWAERALAVEG